MLGCLKVWVLLSDVIPERHVFCRLGALSLGSSGVAGLDAVPDVYKYYTLCRFPSIV
jgi:hypothetical protein